MSCWWPPPSSAAANANQGTDHGTAGPVLAAGTPWGFIGDQPSLTNLDNGDLISTADFRRIYA